MILPMNYQRDSKDDFRQYGQTYRFQLDRRPGRSRLKRKCPKCGREKCFTPYVDVETGEEVGIPFGICDHARTCGYHNRPKGSDVGDKGLWLSNNSCKPEFLMPEYDITNFIPFEEAAKTISPDNTNTMFKFLSRYWDKNLVSNIFRKYYVGTTSLWEWQGCCLFWQIDKNFTCRTGKIMDFEIREDNGKWVDIKRVKEGIDKIPHVMFYHALKGNDFTLRQCLFGEHLLNFCSLNKNINIVESEKTAIICAINKPSEIFIATGGLNNFRPEVMKSLRGRKIIAFPDKGSAFDVWSKKIKEALPEYHITVSDYLQKNKDAADGEDVADLIIRNRVSGCSSIPDSSK